jgi:hypothetical protein
MLLQTTVDGVIDGLLVAGEQLLVDYWWFAALVAIAFYLRMYGEAKSQDEADVPTFMSFILVYRKFKQYAVGGGRVALFLVTLVAGTVLWVLELIPTAVTGVASGDPTFIAALVASVMAAVEGAITFVELGIVEPLGVSEWGVVMWLGNQITPVQVVIGFFVTYGVVSVLRVVSGSKRFSTGGFAPNLRGYGTMDENDPQEGSWVPWVRDDANNDDD